MSDPSRNTWDQATFRRALTKAGRVVSCSWGVCGIRDKKTGEQKAVAVFFDQQNEEFSFAYEFENQEELAFFCADLITLQDKINKGQAG